MGLEFVANDLRCVRGDITLFDDVGFVLKPGQSLRVHGSNGAGKTSLLRLLCGLSTPEKGEIKWQGESIWGNADFRRELIFLGHAPAIKPDLSAVDNLMFAAAMQGQPLTVSLAKQALQTVGLRSREHLASRHLSAGQKRRVLLARLIAWPAQLWILDEPLAALDVKAVEELECIMTRHLEAGGMLILTSHQDLRLPNSLELSL